MSKYSFLKKTSDKWSSEEKVLHFDDVQELKNALWQIFVRYQKERTSSLEESLEKVIALKQTQIDFARVLSILQMHIQDRYTDLNRSYRDLKLDLKKHDAFNEIMSEINESLTKEKESGEY